MFWEDYVYFVFNKSCLFVISKMVVKKGVRYEREKKLYVVWNVIKIYLLFWNIIE